jgi:hypothetical protein
LYVSEPRHAGSASAIDPTRTVDHVVPAEELATVDVSQPDQSTNASGPYLPAGPVDAPTIPGYRITAEIARGGMGRVYAGHDLKLDREVAIKTLLPGANAARFVTEAKITARLPHPNIPPVHALGEVDDTPWLAMKFVHGQTLADLLKDRATPPSEWPRFVQIFEQIAQAVGFAHQRGIIHRDLKPLNVMVGEFGEVQVMDWGLAKSTATGSEASPGAESDATDVQHTMAGTVMGTPGFMAPEQARGEVVDQRADVFALGAILTSILTGQSVFGGTTAKETITQAARGDTAAALARLEKSGTDPELLAIVRQCLEVKPEDRPADGRAVAKLIGDYRASVEQRLQQAETQRAASEARMSEQVKRRRVIRWASSIIAAVLLAGVAVSLWFANDAGNEAKTARKAEGEARDAEGEARKAEKKADDEANRAREAEAKTKEQLKKTELAVYASKLSLAQAAFNENNMPDAFHYLEDCQWNLRGWEHAHLRWKFASSSKQTLKGHTDWVTSVSFSPDGRRLVTGSRDKTAKVWDAEKGTEILSLKGHTGEVTSVSFSPDGRRIVTGSRDKTTKVWDADKGTELLALQGHTRTG